MTQVAYRKSACKVCAAGTDVYQAVNAAVWDGKHPAIENRTPAHRARGVDVMGAHNVIVDVRAITRHAEHVEATARTTTPTKPQVGREVEVYPSDFEGVTDRYTQVGLQALERLGERVDELDPKELVATAKLGLAASTNQKAAAQRDAALRKGVTQLDDPRLMAIFLVGSGHAPEISEHQAINVTPLSEMREAMRAERLELEARARGG